MCKFDLCKQRYGWVLVEYMNIISIVLHSELSLVFNNQYYIFVSNGNKGPICYVHSSQHSHSSDLPLYTVENELRFQISPTIRGNILLTLY